MKKALLFCVVLIFCVYLFQNFVGLSVSEGYIATGSETNEVFN